MAKLSNYPNGFLNGVTVKGVPILNSYSGNVFWVDSGHSAASNSSGSKWGRSPERPYSTVAYAITQCSANNGDIIMVASGHSETPTATIAASTAGIKIVGLGTGADRPAFGGLAASAVFTVSAANICFQNLVFSALTTGTQAGTQKINVAGADCAIVDCEFNCGASDDNAIHVEITGDRVLIENCVFRVSADGPDSAIHLAGNGLSGVVIRNNFFDGNSTTNAWDEGHIYSSGTHTACLIEKNNFLYMYYSPGAIEFVAAATGLLRENFAAGGVIGEMFDPGSCYCMQNFESDAIDKKARVFPTTEVS